MPTIVQLLLAESGYRVVFADRETGTPIFRDVVAWALIEEEEECVDPECDAKDECCCVSVSQGVVPMILDPACRKHTLIPAYQVPNLVGICGPHDATEEWTKKVSSYLTLQSAGLVDSEMSFLN